MIPQTFLELYADEADRSAYRRARTLCMMPADVQAFSDALKAAIPRIRFVSRDYWEQFVDQERWKADCLEYNRRRNVGLPKFELRQYMRDPTGEPLRYWESLADPAEQRFLVWVEPPGWHPLWGPEDTDLTPGVRYIENAPRLWFEFRRSSFLVPRHEIPSEFVEPRPSNAQETVCLQGHRFEVRWSPSEREGEVFGKRVYNVLRRLTDSRFVRIERNSRRAYTGEPEGMLRTCLAGRQAIAWAMKRRHNYLKSDDWGLLVKPAAYPFKKCDVLTPREYKRLIDAEEQKLEENLRLDMEAYKRLRDVPHDYIEMDHVGGKVVAARARVLRGASSATSTADVASEPGVVLELRTRRRRGRLEWA